MHHVASAWMFPASLGAPRGQEPWRLSSPHLDPQSPEWSTTQIFTKESHFFFLQNLKPSANTQ